MEMIVSTEGVDFAYAGSAKVLHQLNLQVPRGSVYCFLGPNGAGKTTTLRLLLGLIRAKDQRIRIFNEDINTHRTAITRRIGSLIEQPSRYGHLTALKNLEVFRLSFGVPRTRITRVLEVAGLYGARNQVVKTYSLGMKQRLAIALALLHDPELLILDEPANGLDPQGIIDVRELIRKYNREHNKTILVSSHLLGEVDKVATHFGIINKGRLVFQGSSAQLQNLRTDDGVFEIEVGDATRALNALNKTYMVEKTGDSRLLVSDLTREQASDLLTLLVHKDVRVYNAVFRSIDLEEVFMKIIDS